MTAATGPDSSRSQPSGSPGQGEPVFLLVGKLHRTHGIQGELVMEVITDFPERLRRGVVVYIGKDRQPHRIRTRRQAHEDLLVSFEGFNNLEEASELRNQMVYVRAEDRPPLPEGEYYHHQLIGLKVISDEGQPLGVLTQILDTGANEVYIVQPESGREILLPAIDEVILQVDLARGEMRVHLLPGLLPE